MPPQRRSRKTPRLLLTAFEPFGNHAANSSLEVARALLAAEQAAPADRARVVELRLQVLPVVAPDCVRHAWQAVRAWKPQVVLALGQAHAAPAVRVERVAINVDDFSEPDNAGNRPSDRPIERRGPAAYFATIPLRETVAAIKAAGVPAYVSNTAGTYVCNHLMYGLLHRASGGGRNPTSSRAPRVGFLHLPYMPSQIPDGAPLTPSLSLDQMVAAVRAAIAACACTRR